MKTSKFILSQTQCVILATMLALSSLSLGCDDINGNNPPPFDPPPKPILEGTWIALDIIGNIDHNNVLVLRGSSGIHDVKTEDGITDKLHIEFLYRKISTSMLRITMIQNRIDGVSQPLRKQEDVYYQIDNESLSIFNQRFVRK